MTDTEQGRAADSTPAAGDPWRTGSHTPPVSNALEQFMRTGWAVDELRLDRHPGATAWAEHRRRLSQRWPDAAIVVPAGPLRIRNDDVQFGFRPSSELAWLTGGGEPDAVLVMTPREDDSHDAVLYVSEPAPLGSPCSYRDARRGEVWTGRRPGLAQVGRHLGLECRDLASLEVDLDRLDVKEVRLRRGIDPALDARWPEADDDTSNETRTLLHEARLVKDDWEIGEITRAVEMTAHAFEQLVSALDPAAPTPERRLEGAFNASARLEGNGCGYPPIIAGGSHATILHWGRNNGIARPGELLLVDAAVETETYYTADVTRTMPVSGRFDAPQRRVYDLVLAAQEAAIAAVRPGASFRSFSQAASEVIARGLAEWGILPHSAECDLGADQQLHRRYTLCGMGHMLGLDVHDCSKARAETYLDGVLEAGHVLTVEPGLYFQAADQTVPEELRGIGVRIEDDVVVTDNGCRLLSEMLPRQPDEFEHWMRELRGSTRR